MNEGAPAAGVLTPEQRADAVLAKWPVWPGVSGRAASALTRDDIVAAIRAAVDAETEVSASMVAAAAKHLYDATFDCRCYVYLEDLARDLRQRAASREPGEPPERSGGAP